MLDGTEFVLARPYFLPDVFEDAAGDDIGERRGGKPVAEGFVLRFRQAEDTVAGEGELRTARLGEDVGDRLAWEEDGPDVDDFSLFRSVGVGDAGGGV